MAIWDLPENHAIQLIKKDHDKVKDLFKQFEKTDSPEEKESIIGQVVLELKMHATVEEEIFYPAVREHIDEELMNEADEEHHVAKVLVAELENKGGDQGHRDAKLMVLAESVRHHIKEEESNILPRAKTIDIDFQELGQKILDRKEELLEKGFPKSVEELMVGNMKGITDSPVKSAGL